MGRISQPLALAEPRERAPLLDRLGRGGRAVDPRDALYDGGTWWRPAVGDSEDLERVLALPRRAPPTLEAQVSLAREMTAHLRRKDAQPVLPGDITDLLPVQGWYLKDASVAPGVLGHVRVGGGKTGIDLLLPMIVPGCRRALLLIPASLRPDLLRAYEAWSRHFRMPNLAGGTGPFYPERPVLAVLSYSDLSHAKSTAWLEAHRPDVVIADEGHNLKDPNSVRTARLARYLTQRPETRFFVHSGSLTTKSLQDYAHLAEWALRDGSPLPISPSAVKEWASAIDPRGACQEAPAGKLLRLCEVGEHVRSGFRRRLVETAGIVATADARLATRLVLRHRALELPAEVRVALAGAREGLRPDGEELVEAVEIAACVRQVAQGIFLRWKYPRGEPELLIEEWFRKRKAWRRELRQKLEAREPHLDSPHLCELAAARARAGARSAPDAPTWHAANYAAWADIESQVQPENDSVWLSRFLVDDACAWARERPGIVWVDHPVLGHEIARLLKVPYFGGGPRAREAILLEKGDRPIVASVDAHGTGRNLQHAFFRNLVLAPPADFEQLVGRTFRFGQRAEVVEVEIYQHVPEFRDALDTIVERAKYAWETTGSLQAILDAEVLTPEASSAKVETSASVHRRSA